jgi:hypothetical protein
MLDSLLLVLSLTALMAGLTGAFSPCGFSMVETIGSALGDARRYVMWLACLSFAIGAVVGGLVTFGGLGLLGQLVGQQYSGLRAAVAVVIALSAAIADWRGVKIAPQIRRQVPERWRWRLPLPLVAALYGVLLGLGFTTFVLSYAVWALAGLSVAVGNSYLGLAIGLAFGLGRALPVIWLAPTWHSGPGAERLERLAAEPRLWLGLRRLDALGLLLAVLVLSTATAQADQTLAGASDPSASAAGLAWQPLSGPGQLRLASGELAVPGIDPALGASLIAWYSPGQITVAELATMTPKLVVSANRVSALAVSDSWLTYRDQGDDGEVNLIAVSLSEPASRRYVAGSRLPGQIGRPSLEGATVVFTVDTREHNKILSVDLASGQQTVLRDSDSGVAFANPALLNGQLLYESVNRCEQALRLGPLGSSGHDRVLLSLPSTAQRDSGYEPGYEANWNSASGCPHRSAGAGGSVWLGPTALSSSQAYVSEVGGAGHSRIVQVAR